MASRSPDPTAMADWRNRYAFGLPPGSVRALLALAIASTLWGYLLLRPDHEVPGYLRDLMFIILGHYFAVRGQPRPEAEGGPEPAPLYLPRMTIRLLLVGGFVAVAVLLSLRGHLLPVDQHPGAVTLLLVGGFLLGAAVKLAASWWQSGDGHRWPRLIEDLKATAALLAAALLALLVWNQALPFLPEALTNGIPRLGVHGPEHLAAAIVGFYFGSR